MTIYEIRDYINEQIEASKQTDIMVNKAQILHNALVNVQGMLTQELVFKWDDLMPHEKAKVIQEVLDRK